MPLYGRDERQSYMRGSPSIVLMRSCTAARKHLLTLASFVALLELRGTHVRLCRYRADCAHARQSKHSQAPVPCSNASASLESLVMY
eukprot:1159839-Pelagomonas_calceolata.AAC.19